MEKLPDLEIQIRMSLQPHIDEIKGLSLLTKNLINDILPIIFESFLNEHF